MMARVHSRWTRLPREPGLPSARGCRPPGSFRPCRSSRLRRLPPRTMPQVCCTLHPAMGFTTFPATPSSLARRPARRERHSPWCIHTLRSVSLVRSRIASPRPLPSRRFRPARSPPPPHPSRSSNQAIRKNLRESDRPQGLAPLTSPLRRLPLPKGSARCSHGLCSPPRCSPRTAGRAAAP
jgi:hypothetical protein